MNLSYQKIFSYPLILSAFFQTIFLNNPALKIFNDNKRFVYWKDSTSTHPEVLRIQDFDRMIASDQHFARKFDIKVDEEVLNMLDQYITAEA